MQELKTIEITKQQKEELVSLILDIKNHRLIDGFQDVVHLVSCIVPEVRHPLPCEYHSALPQLFQFFWSVSYRSMREEIAGLFSYTVFLFWHIFHNSLFEMFTIG